MDRRNVVVVFCTHPNNSGGVANLYRTLTPHLPDNFIYLYVGSRGKKPGFLFMPILIFKFIKILYRHNIQGVIFNPSLGRKALLRDALLIFVAKMLGVRHVVFFHGWNSVLLKAQFWRQLCGFIVNGGTKVLVLAESFKNELISVAPNASVEVFRTAIEIPELSQHKKRLGHTSVADRGSLHILYLGRLEPNKGVLDVIAAVQRLVELYPHSVVLHIAGSGSLMETIRAMSLQVDAPFLKFHGYVRGETKRELFDETDIFAFPTRHGEGLPVSVLEAMSYGLCVVAPLVGGLECQIGPDVIKELTSPSESDLFDALVNLLNRPEELKRRQKAGVTKAKQFDVKVVAQELAGFLDSQPRLQG